MAEEHHHLHSGEKVGEEVTDRGLFDFLGKKKEHEGKCEEEVVTVTEVEKVDGEGKCQQEVLVTEFEKVQVTEAVEEEKKKEGLLEKLHRSHSSSSSSSSDEEDAAEGEVEKKKKKKKSLKDKIKEKMTGGEKKDEAAEEHKEKVEVLEATTVVEDNTIPVEKIDELAPPESEALEKKSLLDKIKEKLPGGKKPAEEAAAPPAAVAEQCADQWKEHHEGDSPKEKKGFLGKIMDKIPGYHKGNGPEESSTTH
ncbi:hypothetical protein Taro_025874 [Colocasia esculenta]|uniref:Dehydrin n=1 Tax=Colocasia esculenta TaxID=4460 RepID=A0A843VA00_COLES|nr:hypothetical protein [Colocasia esculenta]